MFNAEFTLILGEQVRCVASYSTVPGCVSMPMVRTLLAIPTVVHAHSRIQYLNPHQTNSKHGHKVANASTTGDASTLGLGNDF